MIAMSETTVLSIRIDKSVKDRLAKLAASMRRSQSFVAAEAIEEFVAVQEWQIEGIEDALESLDRDEGISHEDVKAWAKSLGTGDPLPKPK